MTTQYPLVLFCCNDRHGHHTGQLDALEVHHPVGDSILSLETEMPVSFEEDESILRIRVAGTWLPVKSRFGHHVGNVCWDSAQMVPKALVDLLNLLKQREWSCTEGEAGLFYIWETPGTQFTAEALETLPGTPTQQACRELRELLAPDSTDRAEVA